MKSRVQSILLILLASVAILPFAIFWRRVLPPLRATSAVDAWGELLQTTLPREATIAWWSPECSPHIRQRLNFFLYPRRLRCFPYGETNDLLLYEPYDDPYLYILLEKPIQGNLTNAEKFETLLEQESFTLLKRAWK